MAASIRNRWSEWSVFTTFAICAFLLGFGDLESRSAPVETWQPAATESVADLAGKAAIPIGVSSAENPYAVLNAELDVDVQSALPPGLGPPEGLQLVNLGGTTAVTGTVQMLGTTADLLIHVIEAEGGRHVITALKPRRVSAQALLGMPIDVTLPASVLIYAPESAAGVELNAQLVGDLPTRFYTQVFGNRPLALELAAGMNIAAAIPLGILPTLAGDALAIDRETTVLATGRMIGGITGSEGFHITADLPLPDARPQLAKWLEAPRVNAMSLELAGGRQALAKLNIDFTAQVQAADLDFSGSAVVPLGRAVSSIVLAADLKEAWPKPFDAEWLTLRDGSLLLTLGAAESSATIRGVTEIAGRVAALAVAIGSTGKVSFSAFIESLSVADTRVLLGERVGELADTVVFPGQITGLKNVHLTFEPGEGRFALGGDTPVNIELDGADRVFDVAAYIDLSPDASDVSFTGVLRGGWAAPFGFDWLNLERVTATFDTGIDGAPAKLALASSLRVQDNNIALEIAIATGATFTGTADRLTLAEVGKVLRDATGVNPLSALEGTLPQAHRFENVIVEFQVGRQTGFTLTANTDFHGRASSFLVSATAGAGGLQTVAGFLLDDFRLGELVPVFDGTEADALEFASAAFILAAADVSLEAGALGNAARNFYRQLYGADDFRLDVGRGINLLAVLPVDEGSLLHAPLRAMGSASDRLMIGGTLPLDPNAPFILAANLPPMSPRFGDTADPPAWFKSGQLALVLRAGGNNIPSFGFRGRLEVVVDEELLAFEIDNAISADNITVAGKLLAPSGTRWRPFPNSHPELGWLALGNTAVELGLTGASLTLGFAGDALIGTKDLGVKVFIGLNAQTGLPYNLAFQGISRDTLGMSDLLELQQRMARTAQGSGLLKAGKLPEPADWLAKFPQLEIRRVADDKPITVRFALLPYRSLSVNIEQGMAISGALWGALNASQDKIYLGKVEAELGFAGLSFDADMEQCLAFKGASFDPTCNKSTADVYLDRPSIDASVQTFELAAGLRMTGDFRTPWFTQRIDLDVGGNAGVGDVVGAAVRVVSVFVGFIKDFSREPIDALRKAIIDPAGLFAVSGVPRPEWFNPLDNMINTVRDAKPGLSSRGVLQAALAGLDVTIPAGKGLPTDGVSPRGCPLTQSEVKGRCWTERPREGDELGYTTECVSRGASPVPEQGKCWLVPPSVARLGKYVPKVPGIVGCAREVAGRCVLPEAGMVCPKRSKPVGKRCKGPVRTVAAPDPTPLRRCIGGKEQDGKCWKLGQTPFSGAPVGGNPLACPFPSNIRFDGRCWVFPPTPEIQTRNMPGLCEVTDITCNADDLANLTVSNLIRDAVRAMLRPIRARGGR